MYPVTIDPTKSYAELIVAGKYNYADRWVSEKNFPEANENPTYSVLTEIQVEVICLNLDKTLTLRKVERYLNRRKLRPATVRELLAFGAQFPDAQWDGQMLVALGSFCAFLNGSDLIRIPAIGFDGLGIRARGSRYRTLGLQAAHDYYSSGWDGKKCQFLAVHM